MSYITRNVSSEMDNSAVFYSCIKLRKKLHKHLPFETLAVDLRFTYYLINYRQGQRANRSPPMVELRLTIGHVTAQIRPRENHNI